MVRNVLTSTQLQQCAGSNVVGLVGTLLAFCLYCYSLSSVPNDPCPVAPTRGYSYYRPMPFECPGEVLQVSRHGRYIFTVSTLETICRDVMSPLQAYTWSVILLLLLYNIGAIFLHGFLSLSAIKTLKATWDTLLWIQWSTNKLTLALCVVDGWQCGTS